MGWGGVGMMTFLCTSTHVRFYTLGTHDHMGWGGVGWGGDDDVPLRFHTCEILHYEQLTAGRWKINTMKWLLFFVSFGR